MNPAGDSNRWKGRRLRRFSRIVGPMRPRRLSDPLEPSNAFRSSGPRNGNYGRRKGSNIQNGTLKDNRQKRVIIPWGNIREVAQHQVAGMCWLGWGEIKKQNARLLNKNPFHHRFHS